MKRKEQPSRLENGGKKETWKQLSHTPFKQTEIWTRTYSWRRWRGKNWPHEKMPDPAPTGAGISPHSQDMILEAPFPTGNYSHGKRPLHLIFSYLFGDKCILIHCQVICITSQALETCAFCRQKWPWYFCRCYLDALGNTKGWKCNIGRGHTKTQDNLVTSH